MKRLAYAPALSRVPLLLAVLLLGLASPAFAHKLQVEPVTARITPQDGFINVEFIGNVQDITQTVNVEDKERKGDSFTQPVLDRMTTYLNEHFLLSHGTDKPLKGKVVNLRYDAGLDPTQARFTLVARYPRSAGMAHRESKPITITSTLFDYLPNSVTMVSVGGLVNKLVSTEPTQNHATIDPSAFASNLMINVRQFLGLGVEHIFTGPDHMLFILAFMFVATNLKSLIKTLTGFTIAHSLTIALTTLGYINVAPRLVDIVVALSIVYVGAENIVLKDTKYRFWVASIFGLVHGMAFATNLRDAGLPEGTALGWSLVSFNLGVEVAQVMICLVVYPLLMLWKRSTEKRARYGGLGWGSITNLISGLIVVAGLYWMIQRIFGGV